MIWILGGIYAAGIVLTWMYGFYEWELVSDKVILSLFWVAFVPVKLLFTIIRKLEHG